MEKKNAQDYLDGQVLLIDKPLEWTSFQVVNKLRWQLRQTFNLKKIKVGHAGTLDPLATGLLIICTGKFTKKISEIQDKRKIYTGIITLGGTTPSFDLETEIEKNHKQIKILTHETNQGKGAALQTAFKECKNDIIIIQDADLEYDPRDYENLLVPEDIPIDIVYEDDDLLVVNKIPGMVVHPGHGNYAGTLINALLFHFDNLPFVLN